MDNLETACFIDSVLSSELSHYGVKGMKWGVRKDRYRENSAKRYEKKASKYQSKLDKTSRASKQKKLSSKRDNALNDASLRRSGKLTSTDKKRIATGAAVVTALAARKAYTTVDSGDARRLMENGKAKLTGKEFEFKKKASNASSNMSPDDVFNNITKNINPEYGKPGTKSNCRRATFAYEMNRRGYDVQATKTLKARGQNALSMDTALDKKSKQYNTQGVGAAKKLFKEVYNESDAGDKRDQQYLNLFEGKDPVDIVSKYKNNSNNVFDTLSKQPVGARGEYAMKWASGGAHSMSYEVFKDKTVIFDNQTQKRYEKGSADFEKLVMYTKSAGFTRLDDKELNTEFLKKWVKNA